MLRLYKPIKHDISKLHNMLEHLVCSVWCEADDNECKTKLDQNFLSIYNSYEWLKKQIDDIYDFCKTLNEEEKQKIKEAFTLNNRIEDLCNGHIKPVYITSLDKVVEDKIKPLLIDFYEELLERSKIPGTKKNYYEELIKFNGFVDCPCCGLVYFESESSKTREEFDHYLPKSIYPFSSVNFNNLVPLCHKCNAERKGVKDPIENNSKAFYPFSTKQHVLNLEIRLDPTKDIENLEERDLNIKLKGDSERVNTWNRLFDIESRYNEASRRMIFNLVREIKKRHKEFLKYKINWTYLNTLEEIINDYKDDIYLDKKFLKVPILEELKNCTWLIDVYD